MKTKWEKRVRRTLSLLLAGSMVLSQGQGLSAEAFTQKEGEVQYLKASRLPEDKLPEGDCILGLLQ